MAAAVARIYYAYPDPNEWAYSGVEGALVFGSQDNGFWFRLVDLGVRSIRSLVCRHADSRAGHPRRDLGVRVLRRLRMASGPYLLLLVRRRCRLPRLYTINPTSDRVRIRIA